MASTQQYLRSMEPVRRLFVCCCEPRPRDLYYNSDEDDHEKRDDYEHDQRDDHEILLPNDHRLSRQQQQQQQQQQQHHHHHHHHHQDDDLHEISAGLPDLLVDPPQQPRTCEISGLIASPRSKQVQQQRQNHGGQLSSEKIVEAARGGGPTRYEGLVEAREAHSDDDHEEWDDSPGTRIASLRSEDYAVANEEKVRETTSLCIRSSGHTHVRSNDLCSWCIGLDCCCRASTTPGEVCPAGTVHRRVCFDTVVGNEPMSTGGISVENFPQIPCSIFRICTFFVVRLRRVLNHCIAGPVSTSTSTSLSSF